MSAIDLLEVSSTATPANDTRIAVRAASGGRVHYLGARGYSACGRWLGTMLFGMKGGRASCVHCLSLTGDYP
ncbi:MAG: hypothetical protein WKG00_14960 [Polyangiaceae bacterium]